MAKKRKDSTPQSGTLFDFFKTPTANKKLKLETGSRHKPAPKHTPKTRKIPFEVKPEDIIVVESDPEDSDIEILDQTPVRPQATQEDEPFEGFGEPSLLVDTPPQEDHEDFLGTPHLLCDGPDDTRLTASSSRGPLRNAAWPKLPLPDSDSVSTAAQGCSVGRVEVATSMKSRRSDSITEPTSTPARPRQGKEPMFPSGSPPSVTHLNATNTASVSSTVSPSPSIPGSTTIDVLEHEVACPICGQDLSALSSSNIQNHVNDCADASIVCDDPPGSTDLLIASPSRTTNLTSDFKPQSTLDGASHESARRNIRPLPQPLQSAAKLVKTESDEWQNGDDENAFADVEVLDAADLELMLKDEESEESCPICSTLLAGMSSLEMQRHVNGCADSSVMDLSPVASSSKQPVSPLRPVTSYQPFDLDEAKAEVKPDVDLTVDDGPGVFSVLMNSHKENEAWKEATVAEDRNFRPTKANGGRRKAPFYKVMTGMPIAVDAFRYGAIPGVTAYFLTHAHSDHYTNLSANWKNGPIYCSVGTGNLIVHMLGVDRKWVHALPMDVPTLVHDTGGVRVTLIEANHCPGSCLILFEGPQTVDAGDSVYKSPFIGSKRTFRYLHCGDFRASPQHVLHPAVHGKKLDCVYLDTTYLDPKYCFPAQSQVITACAELARRLVSGEALHNSTGKFARVDGWFKLSEKMKAKAQDNAVGKILVVVGTYSIGKERIVKAIAKALNTKVYSDARKTAILRCEADPELDALLTSDPYAAGVHLLPLGVINSDRLKLYMEQWKGHFAKAIAFRPTGWTYTPNAGSDTLPTIPAVIAKAQARTYTHANVTPNKNSSAALQVFGVPYSEHSSFFELTCFALSTDWVRIVATVNVGSEASRSKMAKWVERWEAERKKRGGAKIVQHRSPDYW